MMVYRLVRSEYTKGLYCSGTANRWNKHRQEVIYTSQSISLCALELLVHTNGIRPTIDFGLMLIELDDVDNIRRIELSELPDQWNSLSAYPLTQQKGSDWYEMKESLLMSVPSAIIPSERNIVINTQHPDFTEKVRLKEVQDFFWDSRFPVN